MAPGEDIYRTIESPCQTSLREKSSKFLSYAYPVRTEEEIKLHLEALRKKYYDATHHCYAWRLGATGETWRANDDGEPSGTAGKPIHGQLLSFDLTDVLVVVVRYFGGTKLGASGLISTYREAARQVLESCSIVEKQVEFKVGINFPYIVMNGVMKIIKDLSPNIISQHFDNLCSMELSIRLSRREELLARLEKCEGVSILETVQE